MIIRVAPEVIEAMLERAAAGYGYTLAEVDAMWADNSLDEPRLRDLWLIWRDS